MADRWSSQNKSWTVLRQDVANATCVNAGVNAVVDKAGAVGCRAERRCGGAGRYPLDGEARDCWIECFASTVVGTDQVRTEHNHVLVLGLCGADGLCRFQ